MLDLLFYIHGSYCFSFLTDMAAVAARNPTSMSRAKEWSPEAEEAWRFQVAGYRDEVDYKNNKKNYNTV